MLLLEIRKSQISIIRFNIKKLQKEKTKPKQLERKK